MERNGRVNHRLSFALGNISPFRARKLKTVLIAVIIALASFTMGAFSNQLGSQLGILRTSKVQASSNFSITLDASLHPSVDQIPGYDSGPGRPVAQLSDGKTNTDFVSNELIVVTNDNNILNNFVSRWNGKILKSFSPPDKAFSSNSVQSNQHLIRIDTGKAESSKLLADIQFLWPQARGNYSVSSDQGMRLLAAASAEARAGLKGSIGVNFVASGTDFRSRVTSEAYDGPRPYPVDPYNPGANPVYSRNAFDWSFLNMDPPQRIGVTEAWRALQMVGRLDNRIGVAIIDGGISPNQDFPADRVELGPIGQRNPETCTDGTLCPWHGTGTVQAAVGVVDNGFGGAGTGGPVAFPILVTFPESIWNAFGWADLFFDLAQENFRLVTGQTIAPRIISMSGAVEVPDWIAWAVAPLDLVTASVSGSMLIFAAPEDHHKDIDALRCWDTFFGRVCGWWEEGWTIPCEMTGVICVGALGWNSIQDANYSEYGGDVDIWAPGSFWVGPDPDTVPSGRVQWDSGTSIATPYMAGVAALVWAANPSLSADAVRNCIFRTARPGLGYATRYVNAYGAVTCALGSTPPEIQIVSPTNQEFLYYHSTVFFTATAWDAEDSMPTISWNVDGHQVTSGLGLVTYATSSLSLGAHTIRVTATDRSGLSVSDTISITITNNLPPTCHIITPSADGDYAYDGFDAPHGRWYKDLTFQAGCTDPEHDALTLVWMTNQTTIQSAELGRGSGPLSLRLYGGVSRYQGVDHQITLVTTDTSGNPSLTIRRIALFDIV